ncbi:helix-turn-helix domain-containing protein [Jeotgalibacillus terrae]|uniref:Helix-turn-helix domain-containing protein n=1 Tax=Jeotgalibacillus terrae TaxID=587735 RepID=A0ABW5ZE17_9BACL|nr:helix-turn-helix domain-containing protein [Jeotgalibacillus terrae]MBM7579218.1 transcriptional regulator with XRE-family HTH domain [Jeotgalibacillus terrae]
MIGDKIKYLRLKKGYSVSHLASRSNVSKSYLSNLENNKKNNPSLFILSKIAHTLDVSVEYLVDKEMDFEKRHLDPEWLTLIEESIKEGMSKEDFSAFHQYLKFRKNMCDVHRKPVGKSEI